MRPEVCYCREQQVAVDDMGRPLIERMGWEEDQKKEWESKTYSDGDEGQEEDMRGASLPQALRASCASRWDPIRSPKVAHSRWLSRTG